MSEICTDALKIVALRAMPNYPTTDYYFGSNDTEARMKKILLGLAATMVACVASVPVARAQINPTDPQPTCSMCPGTLIPLSELEAYTKKAIAEKLVDQQVRDVDIGKAHVGIGMVYRGKLDKPRPDS